MGTLDDITANRAKRRELTQQIADLDAALEGPEGLVARAFEDGATGPQIATAAGVSKPRVYQIRDGRR
ncbi:hypothetical protein [Mycolicibacterium grossiae]|uniref:Helix-turn-helix DNA binding domain protein n=1 Tax=Mycolicibacterium grossiae TaxID=1552759 RepID=A0A1E8Q9Q5_9MYCO|nr:hypothetical protein [Mycolicibacterium grossiae]OFJ55307.1 hypothetical protein BEL07_02535 [Mycolicibacterium grossiae]QEM46307.1 hypothetical protein FZ046_17390 [Mycolicibacterium grossiae]